MTDQVDQVAAAGDAEQLAAAAGPQAFTFGDPEPVLGRGILDHLECWTNGPYFEPPLSLAGLSKARHASTHHASAIALKVNLLASTFRPHRLLSRAEFEGIALDYVALGNGYVERINNRTRGALRLARCVGRYMRVGTDLATYYQVAAGSALGLAGLAGRGESGKVAHEFPAGSVCHLKAPDVDQEVYGLPEYLSALQSALLNESATLFRRRYYLNGSHAGFILYMTDAAQLQDDVDNLRDALKKSKGPGNFRNLFVYSPNGKKDGIQVIPVSEVAAKDEFLGIKNTTRDDILAAHRVPPQLLGVVPQNAGGFGKPGEALQAFELLELRPLQRRFLALNDWLGEEVVAFDPLDPLPVGSANDNGRPNGAAA